MLVCPTKWKKNTLHNELKGEWDMYGADDLVICLGDNGVGKRNLEGRMLLEFCLEKELCVSTT